MTAFEERQQVIALVQEPTVAGARLVADRAPARRRVDDFRKAAAHHAGRAGD